MQYLFNLKLSRYLMNFAYVTFDHSHGVNHAWHVRDPHSNPVWAHMLHMYADL